MTEFQSLLDSTLKAYGDRLVEQLASQRDILFDLLVPRSASSADPEVRLRRENQRVIDTTFVDGFIAEFNALRAKYPGVKLSACTGYEDTWNELEVRCGTSSREVDLDDDA